MPVVHMAHPTRLGRESLLGPSSITSPAEVRARAGIPTYVGTASMGARIPMYIGTRTSRARAKVSRSRFMIQCGRESWREPCSCWTLGFAVSDTGEVT